MEILQRLLNIENIKIKYMNIVLASDNNFVQHCAVTIVSILRNNANVVIYLLTEGLSSENENLLDNLTKENDGELHILTIQNEILKQFPMPDKKASEHISIATYYRLFVTMILPQEIQKVIYLDCDIVVRWKLDELWNTNLEGFALGAIYQNNEWAFRKNIFDRLSIPEKYGYFNAGVLLINLEYWRTNNVTNTLFSFIESNFSNIVNHDQDVLNAVLHKKTKALSCNWNLLPIFLLQGLDKLSFPNNSECNKTNTEKIKINPTVIHFVSRPKPWEYNCDHPYKNEYFYYLNFTPWKNYRPKFSLSNFIFYSLVLNILGKRSKYIKIAK
jgi:lipopolysaccharide biosynthesis glycosyltransferase